jgi:hypothetical protein
MKREFGLWGPVLFGIEQNFALWTLLLGLLHFPWLHPVVSLPLLALAGWRWYAGSSASKLMAVLWGAGALALYAAKSYELSYFVLGLYLPAVIAAHLVWHLPFVISRRSMEPLPSLASVLALYPGAFFVLHEPGLPIPAMFTASGFIYIPFLPVYAALLKNQALFIEALKVLNW